MTPVETMLTFNHMARLLIRKANTSYTMRFSLPRNSRERRRAIDNSVLRASSQGGMTIWRRSRIGKGHSLLSSGCRHRSPGSSRYHLATCRTSLGYSSPQYLRQQAQLGLSAFCATLASLDTTIQEKKTFSSSGERPVTVERAMLLSHSLKVEFQGNTQKE